VSGDRGATDPAARHGLGRPAILLAAGAAATGVAATGYALQRSRAARYRVDGEGLIAAGLSLPDDVEHHFTTVSDGGRIHAVERGRGPTVVLVHGITLGVAVWAHQLRHLAPGHRVIAIGQRGHGQSLAGTQGYSLERMAEDLAELLESLEVRDATVVGHSLGGMVAQLLALHHSDVIARRVSSLVLVATSATGAPAVPGALRAAGTALATRSLSISAAKGKGIYLQEDLATWLTRLSFGAKPQPADVELTRSMIDAMSPPPWPRCWGHSWHSTCAPSSGASSSPRRWLSAPVTSSRPHGAPASSPMVWRMHGSRSWPAAGTWSCSSGRTSWPTPSGRCAPAEHPRPIGSEWSTTTIGPWLRPCPSSWPSSKLRPRSASLPLSEGRTQVVFGVGRPDADLLFVGEGPGERRTSPVSRSWVAPASCSTG